MPDDITLEHVQALITRAPFHQWLGLTVVAVGDDSVEIKAKWREEWVVNVERRYTHGGILAALIDRVAMPGDLIMRGKVVRAGSQFATAEAQIFDLDGKLICSGRGTYLTAQPKTS